MSFGEANIQIITSLCFRIGGLHGLNFQEGLPTETAIEKASKMKEEYFPFGSGCVSNSINAEAHPGGRMLITG